MTASPNPSAVPDDLREMATTLARQAGCVLAVGAVDIIAAALLQVRNAEREATEARFAELLRDPAAVLANALRGGINVSSVRADERERIAQDIRARA